MFKLTLYSNCLIRQMKLLSLILWYQPMFGTYFWKSLLNILVFFQENPDFVSCLMLTMPLVLLIIWNTLKSYTTVCVAKDKSFSGRREEREARSERRKAGHGHSGQLVQDQRCTKWRHASDGKALSIQDKFDSDWFERSLLNNECYSC